MPVNSTHPDYDATLPDWLRARDVLAGEDAIKSAGEKYLPALESQSEAEYAAYRQRASFFNATARTAEGYSGLIFRRPPFVKIPEPPGAMVRTLSPASLLKEEPTNGRRTAAENSQLSTNNSQLSGTSFSSGGRASVRNHQPSTLNHQLFANSQLLQFLSDCDLLGTSLAGYAKNLVQEVIGVGRAGSLVDWESAAEQRAYVSLYSTEQIINWRVERVNGRSVPTLIVLRETGPRHPATLGPDSAGEDLFSDNKIDQIRVLRLLDSRLLPNLGKDPVPSVPNQTQKLSTINHVSSIASAEEDQLSTISQLSTHFVCVVEIWQQRQSPTSQKSEWMLVERRVPLRLGRPLPSIPFVFHGPRHSRPAVDKPPLNDIIALNLDHYRLDADY